MAVNITWSLSNGGPAIADPLDHGETAAGSTTTAQTVFIEHDGENQIIGCGFYISQKSGTYNGNFSPSSDISESLQWGNATEDNEFGGFQVNMNATGGFPGSSWPVWNDKTPSGGSAFFSGIGDSAENKIVLPVTMGLSNAGVITAGDSPDISFQCRFQIPTNEQNTGIRQIDQKLRFTFTS